MSTPSPHPAHQLDGLTVGVTGGTGFIGRHLVRRLAATGAEIRMLVRPGNQVGPDAGSDDRRPTPVAGTLTDMAALQELVHGCDLVFHAAGAVSVPGSLADPLGCLDTNVMGTTRLLEACRRAQIKRLVILSSWIAGTLDRPTATISPYAAGKAAAEMAVRSYQGSFALPATVVRLSNVYGPGQHPDALIPSLLRALTAGDPVHLYARGIQRDFLFVTDCVDALIRLGLATVPQDQVMELGYGEAVTAERVADVIGEHLNAPPQFAYASSIHLPPEQYVSRIGPLIAAVGEWRRTSLHEGIRAILEGTDSARFVR